MISERAPKEALCLTNYRTKTDIGEVYHHSVTVKFV